MTYGVNGSLEKPRLGHFVAVDRVQPAECIFHVAVW